ncbi:MAG: hypothetical protein EOO75_07520 [Myxococcales bacterium]|nr:MAG: hypothetical protein EOO75_07520 [Myxococcales bacterium]
MTPEQISATWSSLRSASEAWAAAIALQGDTRQRTVALEDVSRLLARIRTQLPQNFLALPTLPGDLLALVLASRSLAESVQDHLALLGESPEDDA